MNSNREMITIDSGNIDRYIDRYMEIYTGAYTAFRDWSSEGRRAKQKVVMESMRNDKNIHFKGLLEDGQLIATMKVIDYDIGLYGRLGKATGLCCVAVHRLYKKRHGAFDLVEYFEQYTKDSGADIALLLPFNMGFYRSLGYGFQSRIMKHSIPTLNLPEHKDISHLCVLGDEDFDSVISCQKKFVEKNHGQLVKFEDDIRNISFCDDTIWIGYKENEELRGYMAVDYLCDSETNYTLNAMEVKDMAYLDAGVFCELLGYLRLQSDQAQRTILYTGEEDFYHILDDAADTTGDYVDYGGLQTNTVALNVMHKILDPERFIERTSYRTMAQGEITVAFDYLDELAGERKSVTVAVANGRWSVSGDEPEVRIRCRLSDLTSIFMGSAQIAALYRLGAIEVSDESRVFQLDSLFRTEQKPFSNSDF